MIDFLVISVLALVDLALVANMYLVSKETARERKELLNVLISKNATELRDLELTQKVEKIKAPTADPNFIPVADLDDEAYTKAILGENIE